MLNNTFFRATVRFLGKDQLDITHGGDLFFIEIENGVVILTVRESRVRGEEAQHAK